MEGRVQYQLSDTSGWTEWIREIVFLYTITLVVAEWFAATPVDVGQRLKSWGQTLVDDSWGHPGGCLIMTGPWIALQNQNAEALSLTTVHYNALFSTHWNCHLFFNHLVNWDQLDHFKQLPNPQAYNLKEAIVLPQLGVTLLPNNVLLTWACNKRN